MEQEHFKISYVFMLYPYPITILSNNNYIKTSIKQSLFPFFLFFGSFLSSYSYFFTAQPNESKAGYLSTICPSKSNGRHRPKTNRNILKFTYECCKRNLGNWYTLPRKYRIKIPQHIKEIPSLT